MIDQSKLERQKEGARKWKENQGRGTLCYPTGFGKTKTGQLIYEPFLDFNKDKDYTVAIAVTSTAIKDQWVEQVKEEHKSRLFVYTADELLSKVIHTTLLIIDEIDMFLSTERFKIIDGTQVKWKYGLGLTANWEDRHKRHERLGEFMPLVDHISEKEALKNKWISQFIEYNIGVDFDNSYIYRTEHIKHSDGTAEDLPMTREEYYHYISGEIQRYNAKFGANGMAMAKRVLNGFKGNHPETGQYVDIPNIAYARKVAINNGWHSNLDLTDEADEQIDNEWNPNKVIGYAKNLFNYVRLRKQYLYDAVEKLPIGKAILDKFPNAKAIAFAESTEFADKFAEYINKGQPKPICTVYHSNIESRPLIDPATGDYFKYSSGKKKGQPKIFGAKTLKAAAINAIKSGDVRCISTARALDRGFNVPSINLVVANSRNSNFQQHQQRGGRAKRVNPLAEDEIVIIVNIYIRYTKEEEWLKEAQSRNESATYWVNTVEQIDYTPKEKYEFNNELFL